MKKIRNLVFLILLFGVEICFSQNIFQATCRGNITVLDSLLKKYPINVQDARGRSLLHWAIGCNQKEVFDFLIARKANTTLEDNQGRTPMYVAITFESEYYFNVLQQFQRDNSWIEKYGTAYLERAVLLKSELFIKKLVKDGVGVNNKNQKGSTPLEIANRMGANEIYQLLLALGADESEIRTIVMTGKYMGQRPPELVPNIFAPNFISTEESEFGSVFNSNGIEFYFGVDVNGKNEIRYSKLIDNQWTKPETMLSHPFYGYNDPFLSNDDNRLYFISKRALDGGGALKEVDIWYADRVENGWSKPVNVGCNINTNGNEYYILLSNNGYIYFASNGHNPNKKDRDIYYSKNIDSIFQKPVAIGNQINTKNYEADAFVSPDESYIIFCSIRDDGFGRGNLYISFRKANGEWTKAVNMGNKINTQHYEYCPSVTKDGKYLFFTRNQDIYWVSTRIIKNIKHSLENTD